MENVHLTDSLNLKINPTLERIFMLLEEGDFWRADNLCSQLLDQIPRCAEAYVGKLMAEIQIRKPEDFLTTDIPYTKSSNFQHAINYSTDPLRKFLMFAPYENFYLRGNRMMQSAKSEAEFRQAGEIFKSISSYKDSSERFQQCSNSAEISRKNSIYDRAVSNAAMDQISTLKSAIEDFKSIPGWKDADQQVISCNNRLQQLETKRKRNSKNLLKFSIIICALVLGFYLIKKCVIPPIKTNIQYQQAISLMNNKDYQGAIFAFELLNGYKDSLLQIEECKMAIQNQKYEEAFTLFQKGDYEAAITAFRSLNGYKDSAAQIENCEIAIKDQKYGLALTYYNEGDYDKAISAFEKLDGYKDSLEQIELCETAIKDQKYNAAFTLYENGNFEEAIAAYTALKGYKDSSAQIEVCKTAIKDQEYDAALALYTAGDYLLAYPALIELNGYRDSTEKAKSIYREYKISEFRNAKVRDYVLFGTYEQDNKTTNGNEDIEWQILAKENNRVLIISRYALDCQRYDNSNTLYSGVFVTWENSSLRQWLNSTFIDIAFNSTEQEMILNSNVIADKNPEYQTDAGNDTVDKVFLLSITEANKYFTDRSRKIEPTNYVKQKYLYSSFNNDGCQWWLRTSGHNNECAAYVSTNGRVNYSGLQVDNSNTMIRPVLWINTNP